MANSPRCGSWIRRFLLEYLVRERNLARNTQCSYRDTLALLMPFVAERAHKPIDQLDVVDVNAENVRQFLQHLEQARHCSLSTDKQRLFPLWANTVNQLVGLIGARDSTEAVFLNRCGRPITRFGIHGLVERYAKTVSARIPDLLKKRVSAHTIRHTSATHLLRSGVDINTIRAWLGHVSVDTTSIYAETDLETKAKALAHCEIKETRRRQPWREDKGLMTFLRDL